MKLNYQNKMKKQFYISEIGNQIRDAKNVDINLVLGGPLLRRTDHYISIVKSSEEAKNTNVVFCGDHYILDKTPTFVESDVMADHAIKNGIPKKVIQKERNSVDTLANIFYAKPLVDEIEPAGSKLNVGIWTDPFHMKRSLLCANWILGDDVNLIGFPTKHKNKTLKDKSLENIFRSIYEPIVTKFWEWDLNDCDGNTYYDKAVNYFAFKHPYYAKENPDLTDLPETWYGALVNVAFTAKNTKEFMEKTIEFAKGAKQIPKKTKKFFKKTSRKTKLVGGEFKEVFKRSKNHLKS